MTEQQAKEMLVYLKKILDKLEHIEVHLSTIETRTPPREE
jgi:hypothetical protein